ncbi:hypothetical protein EYF80_043529 [Liparis tanakae]|uniref:Uncharacterized protein n=1 Tax=Liparis tanakae TaxID=230148 RepID=A0A4Z2FZ84_9TELE|nr:hypothetical protein EYF80_043529 [Liparis tanakae]
MSGTNGLRYGSGGRNNDGYSGAHSSIDWQFARRGISREDDLDAGNTTTRLVPLTNLASPGRLEPSPSRVSSAALAFPLTWSAPSIYRAGMDWIGYSEEELGVGGTALGALRRRRVRRFGRQAVLPVFRIVEGHLQLLPAHFARHQSVLQHAGVVRVGVDLVGRKAAVPEGGRSGEGTGLARLGLAGGSRLALAGGDAGRIDGVVAVEDVGWRAVVTRHAGWRGLASGEGVVGQAGLDGKREVGAYRRDGRRGVGGQGKTIPPQGLQAQVGGAVEGVEPSSSVSPLGALSPRKTVGSALYLWPPPSSPPAWLWLFLCRLPLQRWSSGAGPGPPAAASGFTQAWAPPAEASAGPAPPSR